MVATVLTYEQNYRVMVIQSLKSERRWFSHIQAWFMVNGFFQVRQRMVPFSAEANGE